MSLASAAAAHPLASYRAQFPIFAHKIYLNTCSLSPLAERSRAKVEHFLEVWDARGAAAWYDVWWEALGELRQGYAEVIGATPGEIALHASVSTATAVVAGLLDYAERPRVVTTELDFPTVVYQWWAKPEVELVVVESPDGITVPPEHLIREIDDRTALVATSHVYFTTGAIQDIQAIAQAAHAHGALFFVDAYQSVGQLPVDVHRAGVDFLCAGGLKWLLGGPGIVFLYVRDELIGQLTPTVTGWFANAQQFAFNPQEIRWHEDARRFEMGTPALASVHAQLGGLEVIREIGVPRIRTVVQSLTDDLIARATEAGLAPKCSPVPQDRSAIVMIPQKDPAAAVARLADENIVADARPGHVRLSPFFYNTVEDHVAAIDLLRG